MARRFIYITKGIEEIWVGMTQTGYRLGGCVIVDMNDYRVAYLSREGDGSNSGHLGSRQGGSHTTPSTMK
ncbi:MAG: hypothetical protein HOG08_04625 [Candidatus Magasanikbacteria bacterium]|nr:hypothetical protein [Candidatus Magasanikbacteria bacterium]